jgi:pyridoxine/pyridoxamine 5'-phosphate oxidase
MARGMPIAEQSIATNGVTSVTPWTEARDRFAEANRYWLATVRPDGRPHIMPVFGVWVGDALYFTAARTSRKAKNLALNARCVVAADVPTLDVVVEGEAVRVATRRSSISWPTRTRPSTSGP